MEGTDYQSVQIMWSDGDLRVYPASRLKLTAAGDALANRNTRATGRSL